MANFNQPEKVNGNKRGFKILSNTTLHWLHANHCWKERINLDIPEAIAHNLYNYDNIAMHPKNKAHVSHILVYCSGLIQVDYTDDLLGTPQQVCTKPLPELP